MIQIINQTNRILELDSSSSIPVERKTPLLNEDQSFLQDVTYSSKAGLTDNNKLFIQGGHLVDAALGVYEFLVRVVVNGEPFYSGIFSYKTEAGQISFTIKVNFGTVASKLRTTKMREILTEDYNHSAGTNAAWEALMLNTCQYPKDYPYSFFPVYNEGWYEGGDPTYKWMNFWDHSAQKFVVNVVGNGGMLGHTCLVPFYKLSYILSQTFKYLGFSFEGEVQQEAIYNQLYLYTRRGIKGRSINPCFSYLPDNLTIENFIKGIGARLNINFRWDVLNKKVYADSLVAELSKTSYIDISEYIEKITELSTNEKKGYTVTLKPDQSDEALNVALPDATGKVFQPAFSLVVGGGENKVELEVSTLKPKQMAGYTVPEVNQVIFVNHREFGEWPIRLVRFTGMKSVGGGLVAPEALPYELNSDDAAFYRFLGDSKKVIIYANVPPGVLAKMKTTGKIGLKSAEGTFMYALPAKQDFAFTNRNQDYIPVKIEAAGILPNYQTQFTILPADKPEDTEGGKSIMQFKFAITEGSYGPDQVSLIREGLAGSSAVFVSYPSKSPADVFGIGGHVGQSFATAGNRSELENAKLKLYGQKPQYILAGGEKFYWSTVGDHYEPTISPKLWIDDGRPLLIVY